MKVLSVFSRHTVMPLLISPLNAAVAAGTLAISKFHGGAIEDCILILKEIQKLKEDENLTIDEAATKTILAYKEKKKKISGFGHRVHTDDPRTAKLFQLAEEWNINGKYIEIAKVLEIKLEEITGRKLPINVDGAIGAVLCNMDFGPQLANAFFMIARLPGMVAHIVEEKIRQRPMRKIDPANHEYDGPEERSVPENL